MEGAGNRSKAENPTLGGSAATIEAKAPAVPSTSIKVSLIIDYVFWVLVAVILLRFAFKLIGANSHNTFVTLIYNFTTPVVDIFKGIVGDVVSGTMAIEFSSLITLVILWLVYKAVLRLIAIVR